jgi:hypothetical protein
MSRNSFVNLTSTGAVIPTGGGILESMYVNSTSSGVIHLYHGTTSADIGKVIGGDITPAAGFHFLGNLDATAGVYCTKVSGTIDVTFHVRNAE